MNTLVNTAILASIMVAALLPVAAQGGWAYPTVSSQAGIGGHFNLQPIW